MVVTIELAVLIVVSGLAAGLALALLRSLGFRPLNWLIIFVVDLFRSLPPLVIIVLIYFGLPAVDLSPSGFVSTWLSLAFVLMAFSEEIFWAGITSIAEGAVGGRALDRPVVRPDPDERRAAAGAAAHHPAAHQPHHRHHQGHRARHRRGGHRDPGQASSAMSNSYNPSPLMMGAAAYLVLFLPVVVAGRWVETRFAWKR